MKFAPLPSIVEPVSLPDQIKPRHRLQVVPLADDLVAVFFDAPDQEAVPTSQLAAWSGGEAWTSASSRRTASRFVAASKTVK